MPAARRKAKDDQELTFEEALSNLERIVAELEQGSLGLEESLARFERGMRLLRRCYEVLQQAEQRIEIVTKVDAEGRAVTEPFTARATLDTAEPSPGGENDVSAGDAAF